VRRDVLPLLLLAALPVAAHAPALLDHRLLGPGDGAALHFPLRAEAWMALNRGEVPSWNASIFSGTPLLAAYRAGVFYPPMAALYAVDPFSAFQTLVLVSLAGAGALVYLYLRRLGANALGAYVGGLCFALGPYFVGHLGDTATLVAAPLLALVLLAAEAHLERATPLRAAGLAGAFSLLLLAGSPAAARAGGALLLGRLLLGHVFGARALGPRPRDTGLALLAGLLLAAPQIVPTLLAAMEAGRQTTGLATARGALLPGLTGLVLRYVSHTPAPALAMAALPLAVARREVRVFGVALGLCLALQWGRGPLAAPGGLALVFDFTLAVLAGLSLSAQWQARRDPLGRRLRTWFLFAALSSAAALSVSATVLGPLSQALTGPVGVLALALILYFSLAASPHPVRAGVFLLPLTASFLLQPYSRAAWAGAPTRSELVSGTPTREAIDRAMGPRIGERTLTLVREWPRAEANDLAFGGLGVLAGRRSANGYDPLVPLRSLRVFDGMSSGGVLPGAFFRSDPARLDWTGVRFIQVPASALLASPETRDLGDPLDVVVEADRPRFFSLPITPSTELHVVSFLSQSEDVPQDEVVANARLRLASGRELVLPIRAGIETAEWARDRPDVKGRVRHVAPTIAESFREPGWTFEGHRYLGVLRFSARYNVDGVAFEAMPGLGRLTLRGVALVDAASGRTAAVSLAGAFLSDTSRFREAAATPAVKLYEVAGALGRARVVERVRTFPTDDAVRQAIRGATTLGLDSRREALMLESEARDVVLPAGSVSSRAELVRGEGARIEVRAEGPGLLVVAESWDPGWSASVDDAPARVVRVNDARMGVVLSAGTHFVALRHRVRGLAVGLALAGAGALVLGASFVGRGAASRRAADGSAV
jgi:hypothetical protein